MCLNPKEVLNPRNRRVTLVKCGKCLECLQEYQDGISIRLENELKKYHLKGVYFTLSYDPIAAHAVNFVDTETGEVTPYDSYSDTTPRGRRFDRHRILSVDVRDVQLWLKRGRRRLERSLGYPKDWSYYITAEYGPLSLRPHYHGLFFGLDEEDFMKYFFYDWNSKKIVKRYKKPRKDEYFYKEVENKNYKGNIKFENIKISEGKNPTAVANYVSKYCSKGLFENPRVLEGTVKKCFHLCSKGLGIEWVTLHKKELLQGYKDSFLEIGREANHIFPHKFFEKDAYYGLLRKIPEESLPLYSLEPVYYQTTIRHSKSKHVLPTKEAIAKDRCCEGYFVRPWKPVRYSDIMRKLKHGYSKKQYSVKLYKLPSYDSWYNTICCLPPTLEYCRGLINRLGQVICRTTKEGRSYFLKLPRYYYEKLFPTDSPLRKGLKEALQIISVEIYNRKLKRLYAEGHFSSMAQAVVALDLQEVSRKKQKAARLEQFYVRFYQKSVL